MLSLLLHIIEFAHHEKAKEAEANTEAVGGVLTLDEQAFLMDISRTQAAVLMCPELLDFVKPVVRRCAKLAKALCFGS